MQYLATTGTAGVIEINGTVIVELLTFLVIAAVVTRYVSPGVVKIGEARQLAIAPQLLDAEQARAEAEARLQEAQAKLEEARKTAQEVIDSASKSGEQLRQDLGAKAEDDAKRIAESARKDIEAERDRALQSAGSEVAAPAVTATEKVIGETLDERQHRRPTERAIEELRARQGR